MKATWCQSQKEIKIQCLGDVFLGVAVSKSLVHFNIGLDTVLNDLMHPQRKIKLLSKIELGYRVGDLLIENCRFYIFLGQRHRWYVFEEILQSN